MKELKNLLPETNKALLKIAKLNFVKDFTFVGGSALTVYLNHRLSEDIDLFSWNKSLNSFEIKNEIENADFNSIKWTDISEKQINCIADNVKITAFADGLQDLKQRSNLIDNLYIADIKTIAFMKINTLFLRAKMRDYYDLYVLNKNEISINEMYNLAVEKMGNLNKTLFQRALVFTSDISDENISHLKPKYKIGLAEIEKHFINEIKKWNKLT